MFKFFKPKKVNILGEEFSVVMATKFIESALSAMKEVAVLKKTQGANPNEIETAALEVGVAFLKAAVNLKRKT